MLYENQRKEYNTIDTIWKQIVEEYFFSKIKFINILTFSLFSLIYRRIYIQNIILILFP